MRNMLFNVKNHPTKETAGVTTVSDEHILDDGTKPVIEMGQLTKTRGVAGYLASFLVSGKLVGIKGLFSTRSRAGHAVRAAFEKDLRSEKTKTRAPVKTVVDSEQAKRDKRNARKRELRAAKRAESA